MSSSDHLGYAPSNQPVLSLSMALMLGLWMLALLLSPLYLFSSGVPQPADFISVFLLICLYVLGRLRWSNSAHQTLRTLALFVAYACAVNFIWAVILYGGYANSHEIPIDVLLAGIYYLFNLCIATAVASMAFWMGSIFVNWTILAILLSSMIQAGVAWQLGINEEAGRTTAFFENPNQLAYFAVLNASLLLVLSRSGHAARVMNWLVPLGMLALIYLAVASSSRAGLAGIGLACVLLYIDNWLRGLLLTLVLSGVILSGVFDPVIEGASSRASKSHGFWEELSYRGYDRMWNHPEYMVFGAGEGQTERLISENARVELHSTPGTLLFSYGIVGSLLFALALWTTFRNRGLRAMLPLLPVFIYGLTHQGLRQGELWMLLSLIACQFGGPNGVEDIDEDLDDDDDFDEDDQEQDVHREAAEAS